MQPARVDQLVSSLQTEVGMPVGGSGSLTIHFQDGQVQTLELTLHTRVHPKPPKPPKPGAAPG